MIKKFITLFLFTFSLTINCAQIPVEDEQKFIETNKIQVLNNLNKLLNEAKMIRHGLRLDVNIKQKLDTAQIIHKYIKYINIIINLIEEHQFENALDALKKLNQQENSKRILDNCVLDGIQNPITNLENIVNFYAKKLSNAFDNIETNFPEDLSHIVLSYLQPHSFKLVKEIEIPECSHELSWSSNNLLAVSNHNEVHIYNTTTFECIKTIPGIEISKVAWSPNGKRLAIISKNPKFTVRDQVFIYKTRNYKLIKQKTNRFSATDIRWSNNSKMLAILYGQGTFFKIVNASNWRTIKKLELNQSPRELAWSNDDKTLATIVDNEIRRFDTNSWTYVKPFVQSFDVGGFCFELSWSPDGSKLKASNYCGCIKIWNANFGHYCHLIPLPIHFHCKRNTCWSPNSKTLASFNDDRVLIWDVKTGECIQTLTVFGDVEGVEYSPDGNQLAVCCETKLFIFEKTLDR
jgi:WD40 repeat protein